MAKDIRTVELTLAIPLRFLGDEHRAIRNKLKNLVSTYVPELDGVLVKYSDLKILSDKGLIIDEQPYIFWKVKLTAQVFKPVEGKLVKGRVHTMMKAYFIVKALNSFTATVTVPEELSDHSIVKNLMIDQEIYFKIRGCADGVYRGEIDDECLDLTKGLIKEKDMNTEEDVYEYAKNFEY